MIFLNINDYGSVTEQITDIIHKNSVNVNEIFVAFNRAYDVTYSCRLDFRRADNKEINDLVCTRALGVVLDDIFPDSTELHSGFYYKFKTRSLTECAGELLLTVKIYRTERNTVEKLLCSNTITLNVIDNNSSVTSVTNITQEQYNSIVDSLSQKLGKQNDLGENLTFDSGIITESEFGRVYALNEESLIDFSDMGKIIAKTYDFTTMFNTIKYNADYHNQVATYKFVVDGVDKVIANNERRINDFRTELSTKVTSNRGEFNDMILGGFFINRGIDYIIIKDANTNELIATLSKETDKTRNVSVVNVKALNELESLLNEKINANTSAIETYKTSHNEQYNAIMETLSSDDISLDTLREIVAYIKANREDLSLMGNAKVDKDKILTDLTSASAYDNNYIVSASVVKGIESRVTENKVLIDKHNEDYMKLNERVETKATKSELNLTKSDLASAKEELASAKEELASAKEELASLKEDLYGYVFKPYELKLDNNGGEIPSSVTDTNNGNKVYNVLDNSELAVMSISGDTTRCENLTTTESGMTNFILYHNGGRFWEKGVYSIYARSEKDSVQLSIRSTTTNEFGGEVIVEGRTSNNILKLTFELPTNGTIFINSFVGNSYTNLMLVKGSVAPTEYQPYFEGLKSTEFNGLSIDNQATLLPYATELNGLNTIRDTLEIRENASGLFDLVKVIKTEKRDYVSGDEDIENAITDNTETVIALATPSEETIASDLTLEEITSTYNIGSEIKVINANEMYLNKAKASAEIVVKGVNEI